MYWVYVESKDGVYWCEFFVVLYLRKLDKFGDEFGMFIGSVMVYEDELYFVLMNFIDIKVYFDVV